ncbi:MAG: baseplate J/gp47 family protein [Lachnospirales bacterium]
MYEHMTYENILDKMLSNVPKEIDKREGAIIYDAIAPCAIELTLMYIELDNILKETFADTASYEYLVRRCKERGIIPYTASFPYVLGEFNCEVEIGTRFSLDSFTYNVYEKIADFEYSYILQCETLGILGNNVFGDIVPIEYINGLTSAKITELLIPGEEAEDIESLRTRYFKSFDNKAYGGNQADYLEKVNAIEGVGGVKVTPVWQGGGTVLITILDSEYNRASDVLVDTVQQIVDPTKDAMGYGVAPIGHIVTVDTVNEVMVNVTMHLTFDTGYSYEDLEVSIVEVIENYLQEERVKWGGQGYLLIRIAYIEARILAIKGVLDIENTKINGASSNLTLGSFDIPIFGSVVNG